MKTYPNIEAFYSENEARRRSGEADYGVWWTNPGRRDHWRVSYIQATGEVYAVRLHDGGEVEVLGVISPDPDDGSSRGPQSRYYRTLDRILEGWPEHCIALGGLAWIRTKLSQP